MPADSVVLPQNERLMRRPQEHSGRRDVAGHSIQRQDRKAAILR
jgi:hypothetical protein